MERRELESAATRGTYLRGLLEVPLGALFLVTGAGNLAWGPLRQAWAFPVCVVAIGLLPVWGSLEDAVSVAWFPIGAATIASGIFDHRSLHTDGPDADLRVEA